MSAPAFWLNGRVLPAAEAVVPLNDHGLLYGDGVFEGIRFYRGCPFRLGAHLQRLEDSARALLLALPLDRTGLEAAVAEVIAAFGEPDGYLRLVATRGPGGLGLDPTRCGTPNLFIIAHHATLIPEARRHTGIALVTASTRRPRATVLDPRIKSLNYLNNILAKLEAHNAGADEALLLNEQGYVAEATAENLFIGRDGQLFTPPISDGILDGITRSVVLELCDQAAVSVTERSLTAYDLYTADECFLCGTAVELVPVRSVDRRPVRNSPGALYARVRQHFMELLARECR